MSDRETAVQRWRRSGTLNIGQNAAHIRKRYCAFHHTPPHPQTGADFRLSELPKTTAYRVRRSCRISGGNHPTTTRKSETRRFAGTNELALMKLALSASLSIRC